MSFPGLGTSASQQQQKAVLPVGFIPHNKLGRRSLLSSCYRRGNQRSQRESSELEATEAQSKAGKGLTQASQTAEAPLSPPDAFRTAGIYLACM